MSNLAQSAWVKNFLGVEVAKPDGSGFSPETAAWASGIDLAKARQGSVIKSGAFGTVSWVDQAPPSPGKTKPPLLVMKVPSGAGSRAELEHEAAFYSKAGDHPNLPKCLGMREVEGTTGLVMEGIKGKDMRGAIDMMRSQYESGKLSHGQFYGALQYTVGQMLDTIEHLREHGIVHNDIRPDNVMIEEATGGIRLVDMGVAVEAGQAAGKQPVFAGSVSPDRLTGKVDTRHDVFGAGASAYQAAEGDRFRYHGTGTPDTNDLKGFAERDASGAFTKQALRPADAANPAFRMVGAPGAGGGAMKGTVAQRVPGRFGADTAYTDFINRMMDPDPKKRLSPTEARNHPFLADPLLNEAGAREVLKRVLAPKPPAGQPPSKRVYDDDGPPGGKRLYDDDGPPGGKPVYDDNGPSGGKRVYNDDGPLGGKRLYDDDGPPGGKRVYDDDGPPGEKNVQGDEEQHPTGVAGKQQPPPLPPFTEALRQKGAARRAAAKKAAMERPPPLPPFTEAVRQKGAAKKAMKSSGGPPKGGS